MSTYVAGDAAATCISNMFPFVLDATEGEPCSTDDFAMLS